MTEEELTPRQQECARRNGHCWHRYTDLMEEFYHCCACTLRKNVKVYAKQETLL